MKRTFWYRARGQKSDGHLAAHPLGPKGPWLEGEAETFDQFKRLMHELSAENGIVYELSEDPPPDLD